ncbi:MAG: hypothetical protein FWH55_06500, partial [Oscillospiraceae bacterium]|nr:hypothetical protein [Oscillospiraceae bacterium]
AGTILFFVGGGFGFSYFFDLYNKDPEAQSKMSMLMTGFYTTPTNYTSQGVYWVNVIADLIIPQRATLFGWLILAPCLFLLVRAWLDGKKEYFAPLAVLAGGLPLIHTHSFLALGIISAVCILFAVWDYFKKREGATTTLAWFAFYGCAAVLLAAPQLFSFTFAQSSGGSDFVRFQFNWVNKTDNYFWFYIKNIGLPYLLMIPAFIHADLRGKRLFAGGLAILVICEFIVFQPNEYDNNKLLFIWYLLLCGITVTFLGDVFCSLRKSGVKGAWVSAALIVCVMNLSGVLTLVREIKSNHVLFGAAHVEAAEYIKENTLPGSLFLTSDNHLNTVAALTGRNILCGSGSFLHFHGVDYSDLRNWQLSLLGEPTMESLEEMGIDYVFASDYERGLDYFNEAFFEENCEIVFDNGIVRIYKVARLHDAITPS